MKLVLFLASPYVLASLVTVAALLILYENLRSASLSQHWIGLLAVSFGPALIALAGWGVQRILWLIPLGSVSEKRFVNWGAS